MFLGNLRTWGYSYIYFVRGIQAMFAYVSIIPLSFIARCPQNLESNGALGPFVLPLWPIHRKIKDGDWYIYP